MFMIIQRLLPILFAPLLVYLESSRSPLQFMYLSFFLKMLCFRCTDPFPKNELVLLLCMAVEVVSLKSWILGYISELIGPLRSNFREKTRHFFQPGASKRWSLYSGDVSYIEIWELKERCQEFESGVSKSSTFTTTTGIPFWKSDLNYFEKKELQKWQRKVLRIGFEKKEL